MACFETVRRHGLPAKGAQALLRLPQGLEKFRTGGCEGLTQRPAGTGSPRRSQAAITVLRSRQAIVIGPTPPGTGVI